MRKRFRYLAIGWLCLAVVALGALSLRAEASEIANASGQSRLGPGDAIGTFGLPRLLDMSGPKLFVDDIVGKRAKTPAKVLLIGFMASWCEPCHRDFPGLVKLAGKYKANGLFVLMIDIDDTPDGLDRMRRFVGEKAPGFPVLVDRYHIVARRFLGERFPLPAYFLVDESGKVVAEFSNLGEKTLPEIEAAIAARLDLEMKKTSR